MVKRKNFEDSIKELELIVNKLESGSLGLDAMLKLFEEGMNLTNYCQNELNQVEQKISIIINKNGKIIEKEGI